MDISEICDLHIEKSKELFSKEIEKINKNYTFDEIFLDKITKNSKAPLEFLLAIGKEDIQDNNRFLMFQYILSKFEKDIPNHLDDFYKIIPIKIDLWLKCLEMLCKYDFIDFDIINHQYYNYQNYNSSIYILKQYLQNHIQLNNLEEQNVTLEKKVDELETHLMYMPGGEGYLRAKKNFEKLKQQQQ